MTLNYSIIIDKSDLFLKASLITIEISVVSLIIAIGFGIIGALLRISKFKILNVIGGFYVWIIRGTPLIVQLFILYFGLPQLGIQLTPMVAGIFGLSFNTGAYITEIIRSGINAIDKGQVEAAESLGMNHTLIMIRIIAPQVVKIIIPTLVNQFIITLKNSSLVSLVTITELFRAGEQLIATTFRSFEVYTTVAFFYLIMTSVLMWMSHIIEKRMVKS
jgi:His/Glu/Gln/Arg/opine family amino acid ABC transporter permease subunit